jgi:hypothetical protein
MLLLLVPCFDSFRLIGTFITHPILSAPELHVCEVCHSWKTVMQITPVCDCSFAETHQEMRTNLWKENRMGELFSQRSV